MVPFDTYDNNILQFVERIGFKLNDPSIECKSFIDNNFIY